MKLTAITHVIAWGAFWAFGLIALTAPTAQVRPITIAMLLAALGAGIGLWTWFQLVRHSEATGYARPANRVLGDIKCQGGRSDALS